MEKYYHCGRHHDRHINQRRSYKMDNCNANKSIECSVTQCRNHCTTGQYCALDKIRVGTHESNPTMDQCTDCLSFEKK